jgi:hypothetical protein
LCHFDGSFAACVVAFIFFFFLHAPRFILGFLSFFFHHFLNVFFFRHFSVNFDRFSIVSRSFFGQFLPFLCHFVALPPPVLLHVFFFLIPQVPGAVTALFARLADSLAHRSRLDKEDRALELALTLVRNMLRVPDGPGCVAVAGSDSGCLDVAVWQCGCVAVAVAVAAVWLWM